MEAQLGLVRPITSLNSSDPNDELESKLVSSTNKKDGIEKEMIVDLRGVIQNTILISSDRNYVLEGSSFESLNEPATTITAFKNLPQIEFSKNMNFLSTFRCKYICEVLNINWDSQEFATHTYKELDSIYLKSLQIRTKLKLISQLLKLALFFESRHIKNYKLDIKSSYFYKLNDEIISLKFYDFSDCEYSPNTTTENTFDSTYLYQSIKALDITITPSANQASISKIISFISQKNFGKKLPNSITPALIDPVFHYLNTNNIKQSPKLIKNLATLIKHSKKYLV